MTNCGFMSIDQTFHTPSFGDEEFEVPPLSLAGPGRCNGQEYFTNQIVSYHRAQALPLPQEQNSCHQLSNGTLFHVPSHHQQQHIMSNGHQQYHSNQMSPPPQQQSRGSSLSPPNHITQQQQQQQNMYQNDMMHSMNMQLQQSFDVQTTFSNTPVHQRAMHPQMAQHLLQQQQQQQQANSVMGSPGAMGPPQQVFSTISQSQLTNQLGLQIGGVQHHHHNNQRPPSVGGSTPPISNHNSPGRETSEDSDDSTPLAQLNATRKRPSPEPVEIPPPKVTKKTKPQKKKKKRDPNEPQKPVSAYALFFRDTQAAIKGQNPNASFGEVSKIVASMWDGLETEAKNVYKKKTETAKKEYLKALAAYRATLVSKAAVDQSDSMYSSLPMGSSSPPVTNSPVTSPSGVMLSPMQKKSPPFPTLIDTMQPVTLSGHPQQLVTNQQVWHMSSQHMMNSNSPPQMMQGTTMVNMQQHQQPPTSQMAVMNHPQPQQMSSVPPQHCQSASNSPNYLQNMSPVSIGGVHPNMGNREMMMPVQICLRSGCSNPAVESEEWENDYCSSECVVSHCKDVFSAWVAQRQASAVK